MVGDEEQGHFLVQLSVAFSPEPLGKIIRMSNQASKVNAAELAALHRAFELALRGPLHGPNPRVGCVLLDGHGNTVSEGWHEGSGTPHAEVVALQAARDNGRDTAGLTAVVTLEPCSHTGKTGPCVEALKEAGISRVVYSVSDPGMHSGGGAEILAAAGIDVVGGVEDEQGLLLIERWHYATKHSRPWITIKWAMSLDGRAAAEDGSSQWITGPATREWVHASRAEHDVIAVGTNTALLDDPSLTARTPQGGLMDHQPMAVVVGERPVPESAKVRAHPGGFLHYPDHNLSALLSLLFTEGKRSVYVEGGPTLASVFIREGLADEIHITQGSLLLGGSKMALHDIGVSSMSDAVGLNIRSVSHDSDDIVVVARPRDKRGV